MYVNRHADFGEASRAWKALVTPWARPFSGRALAALIAVAIVTGACGHERASTSESKGAAKVVAHVSSETTSIAKVTVVVSGGDGPSFTSLVVDLQPAGSSWSALVTGIPSGPGRQFDVVALDATHHVVCSGSGKGDIVAGAAASVSIALQVPTMPAENTAPVIDDISPVASAAPGASVEVRASAHDPDGDTLSYLWSASCGTFDVTSSPVSVWTAPRADPTNCTLTITVSDGEGAHAASSFTISVIDAHTIAGTRLATFWPDSPSPAVTVPAPDVATTAAPSAFVHDPSGHWAVYVGGSMRPDGTLAAGQFAADGSFAIPGVPDGTYALCHGLVSGGMACTQTSARKIDLGYDVLGRLDQAPPAHSTPVTFDLSGLEPWNPIVDQIQLTSSSADLLDVIGSGGAIRGGDTGGNLTEDWAKANGSGGPLNLLEPMDVLFIHQLSTKSIYAAGTILSYAAATQATQAPASRLLDGQAASIVAALTPLPLASVDLKWDLQQFETHRAALGPPTRMSVGPKAHTFRIGANAFPLEYPAPTPSAGSPELVRFELPAGVGPVDGTLSFGRFLPTPWHEWWEATFVAQVSYLGTGATLPLVETAGVQRREASSDAIGVVAPAVGPVLSPRMGGSDALLDAIAVGLTPTLSWSPPAVGSPTAYVVEVYRLETAGTATTSSLALRYVTSGATVVLPPGVLEAGHTYYSKITAEVSTVPYDVAPFRRANVFARSTVLTGTFSP
jgi:Big-like domain-containing protein